MGSVSCHGARAALVPQLVGGGGGDQEREAACLEQRTAAEAGLLMSMHGLCQSWGKLILAGPPLVLLPPVAGRLL